MRFALCLAAFLIGSAAAAQSVSPTVRPCGPGPRVDTIAEPWEANTRTFANGEVRIALIDMVEPAAAWAYLLILSPPYLELGLRQCMLVGNGSAGFSQFDFAALEAGYDPARGLVFTVPVGAYVDGSSNDPMYHLEVTLNQSTGAVQARVLGRR